MLAQKQGVLNLFLLHIRLAAGERKRKKSSIRDDSLYHPRTPSGVNKMEEDDLIDFLPAGNSWVALGLHPAPGHASSWIVMMEFSQLAPYPRQLWVLSCPALHVNYERTTITVIVCVWGNKIMNSLPNSGHLLQTSNKASHKRSLSLA